MFILDHPNYEIPTSRSYSNDRSKTDASVIVGKVYWQKVYYVKNKWEILKKYSGSKPRTVKCRHKKGIGGSIMLNKNHAAFQRKLISVLEVAWLLEEFETFHAFVEKGVFMICLHQL